MAAEHKGNMGEIFYFPVFGNFYSNCHFPQLKNYIKIKKAMTKLHFHRTRNEDNFILATAFCDQNNSRQAQ